MSFKAELDPRLPARRRGVGDGNSRQGALKLRGPLTLAGGGPAAALADDISAGNIFEEFQTEKVPEPSAVRPPPPDTHTWVSDLSTSA